MWEPGRLENPGKGWDSYSYKQLRLLRVPVQGTWKDPQGLGDRKRRPPKTRDQKGAQVITHRDEWGRRSGGGAKEGPRDGRGTNPSPSLNP